MKLTLLALALFISGCAHSVHQVHISEFSPKAPIERGDMVKAQAEQHTIMGFVGDTRYVDQAYLKLMKQCSDGTLTGISTQYWTSFGFFSWTNKVRMEGLCIK